MTKLSAEQRLMIAIFGNASGIEKSKHIASLAHQNQTDPSGEPHIDHIRRVAENVSLAVATEPGVYTDLEVEVAVQAAWLHNCSNGLENIDLEYLESWGMDSEVIAVVELLTKTSKTEVLPEEDPYYLAIKRNRIAKLVKICDLADNSNLQRVLMMFEDTGKNKSMYSNRAADFLTDGGFGRTFFDLRIALPTETSTMKNEGKSTNQTTQG
jgi:(p)ppGpp synthase/HD superfamily hydrolase